MKFNYENHFYTNNYKITVIDVCVLTYNKSHSTSAADSRGVRVPGV